MTTSRILLPVLFTLLLSACTPYYYGVREDVWVTMSEPERLAAIDAYRERQLAIQRANEVRAQQQRIELERLRLAREEEEARHRARIEAFYQMQHYYGDMVRVRLQGGTIRINGFNRGYRPVVFTITDGEVRNITVYANNGDIVDLQVAYIDGLLYFDGAPTTQSSRTARFSLNLDWETGYVYAGVNTRNVVSLANVEIYVEVIDTRYYDLRRGQLPAIVIHQNARHERYDQRRLDAIKPMRRLNWPDRRDQQYDRDDRQYDRREQQHDRRDQQYDRREQQYDRRDQRLDQREQQLDQQQQQLNQREREMNRDQRQLDQREREMDRDQRQFDRQQQVEQQKQQLDRQQQQVEYQKQQQLERQQQQRQQVPDSRYARPGQDRGRPEQPAARQPQNTLKSQPATTPAAKKPATATPSKKPTLYDKRKPTSAKDAEKQAREKADKKDESSAEEEKDNGDNGKETKLPKDPNEARRLSH